jgi:ribonuclease E
VNGDEKRRPRNRRNRNRGKDRPERNQATQNDDTVISAQDTDVSYVQTAMEATPVLPSSAPAPIRQAPEAPKPVLIIQEVKVPHILPQVKVETLSREPLDVVLNQVGLVWVDTDRLKYEAVAQQIAAQPAPIHIPREPRPAKPTQEEPMILVETGGAEKVIH